MIDIIAGARPNFVKIAPIIWSLQKLNRSQRCLPFRLIHTGQHYDYSMSEIFFKQLKIPEPDIYLNTANNVTSEVAASVLSEYTTVLKKQKPLVSLVVGDVDSTMACSIAAKKLNVEVAHVEAGIRSFDWSMPEEINRVLTDSITDLYFTTTEDASRNLVKCGAAEEKIFFVGNTMIDTLLRFSGAFLQPPIWEIENLDTSNYLILTIHRRSNVDDIKALKRLINAISVMAEDFKIIFPVHPRLKSQIWEIENVNKNLILTSPLSYLEFNYLVKYSKGIITDSGGISEEASILDVPCITLRTNTERPETVLCGTNVLVGNDIDKLNLAIDKLRIGEWKNSSTIPLWDGKTSDRIVKVLNTFYGSCSR